MRRRRALEFAVSIALATAVIASLILIVRSVRAGRSESPGVVRVYSSEDGRKLWEREVAGGFVVILALTPQEALVADLDGCGRGSTDIERISRRRTKLVANIPGCNAMRGDFHVVVSVRRNRARNVLRVTLPGVLSGRTVELACPCATANRIHPIDSRAFEGYGAWAVPRLGDFSGE